jgi:hypothetical protein
LGEKWRAPQKARAAAAGTNPTGTKDGNGVPGGTSLCRGRVALHSGDGGGPIDRILAFRAFGATMRCRRRTMSLRGEIGIAARAIVGALWKTDRIRKGHLKTCDYV